MSLPAYTWDQATLLGLATARGFGALGIKAATVRQWARRGHLRAVGKAAGGAHLYVVADVVGFRDERERAPYTLILFRRTFAEADTLAALWRDHVRHEGGEPQGEPSVRCTRHGTTIAYTLSGRGTRPTRTADSA